jgi:hypothetical protein
MIMSYMFSSSEEKIANEWKKYEGYTVRPVLSTISYYEKVIAHHADRGSCMMYGGTPEIRSLFQQKEIAVTLHDRSELIVRSMGHLTAAKQPIAGNESFFERDWTAVQQQEENTYDLLIGDDAINMVPWNEFDRFLENANHMLNEDGIFVCHLLVKPDDSLIDQTFNEVSHDYWSGSIKSKYDLASRLNFISYDRQSYAMGWQQTINTLGAAQLSTFIPDFDFIDTFGMCNSKFYCPPQLAFEALAKDYFVIREVFYPHEHDYCLFEPVYILQKVKEIGNEK